MRLLRLWKNRGQVNVGGVGLGGERWGPDRREHLAGNVLLCLNYRFWGEPSFAVRDEDTDNKRRLRTEDVLIKGVLTEGRRKPCTRARLVEIVKNSLPREAMKAANIPAALCLVRMQMQLAGRLLAVFNTTGKRV